MFCNTFNKKLCLQEIIQPKSEENREENKEEINTENKEEINTEEKEEVNDEYKGSVKFEVILEDKSVIGKVIKVEEYPAQSTLRVKTNNKEILIPFVNAFIKKVDIKNKTITVRLIEGML